MADRSPPLREYWASVGGVRLRAHVWNDDMSGTPLVFLNGIGTNLELAHGFMAQFTRRRVVALEMPGCGLTPATDTPLPPALLARMTVQAFSQLGADRFDLAGFSLGGVLAQQIALQYRDRLRSLVLAGTCSGFTMLLHDWSEDALMGSWPPFASIWRDLERDLTGAHMKEARIAAPHDMAAQLATYTGWSSLAFLPFISVPTLVLAGAQDRIIAPANALQLSAFIPGASHHIITDAGHLFPFTAPERTAARIRDFLEAAATGRETEAA